MMKLKISELLPILISGLLVIGWMIGLWRECIPYRDWALYVYAGLIVAVYFSILWSVSIHLDKVRSGSETVVVFLFFLTSFLLVVFFGFGWQVFGNFSSASNPTPSKIDAFYFSVVAFTTLGFGDFVPNTDAGKIFLSVEALMGVTHMVAFFSIVIGRVIPNTSKG